MQRFGRTDAVQKPEIGLLVPAPKNLRRQRFTRGHAGSDRRKVRLLARKMLQIGGIKRRHAEIERWPESFDQWKAGRRAGAMFVQHRGGADPKWEREIVAKSIREKQLRLGVKDIVLTNAQCLDAEPLTGDGHVTMAMDCPFRSTGGAGRVEPEAAIFGGCRHGIELRLTLREQRGKRIPLALGMQSVTRRPQWRVRSRRQIRGSRPARPRWNRRS